MSATIKLNRFKEASFKTVEGIDKGVRVLGFALQEEAQANIRTNKSIDTGSLINSAYTETSKSKGARERAVAKSVDASMGGKKSRKKSKKGRQNSASMATPSPTVAQQGKAKVAFAVEHAVYVEMGVQNAFGKGIVIPAKPFLHPAVETITQKAPGVLASIVREELGT